MSGIQNFEAADHVERLRDWGIQADDGLYDVSSAKLLVKAATVLTAAIPSVVLPAVPNRQYKVLGAYLKFTGSFNNLTDFRLSTTEGTPTDIMTVVLAQAGDGVKHTDLLALVAGTHTTGAGFNAALAAGYGVQLRLTGTAPTAGTSVDVVLLYQILA